MGGMIPESDVTEDCATLSSAQYWQRVHSEAHPNEKYVIIRKG